MTRFRLLLLTLGTFGCGLDPVIWQSRAARRNLDCLRLTEAEAAARFPGQVRPTPAKVMAGDSVEVLTCSPRALDRDDRNPRDEAILSTLSAQVTTLTETASALVTVPVLWHVDAYLPTPAVAQKIVVAARTTMAERGLKVSDRVPALAAGDVAVLAKLPPSESYRHACARAFALESLKDDEVLLGLMVVDDRETELHGGVCQRGEWRWLR